MEKSIADTDLATVNFNQVCPRLSKDTVRQAQDRSDDR